MHHEPCSISRADQASGSRAPTRTLGRREERLCPREVRRGEWNCCRRCRLDETRLFLTFYCGSLLARRLFLSASLRPARTRCLFLINQLITSPTESRPPPRRAPRGPRRIARRDALLTPLRVPSALGTVKQPEHVLLRAPPMLPRNPYAFSRRGSRAVEQLRTVRRRRSPRVNKIARCSPFDDIVLRPSSKVRLL